MADIELSKLFSDHMVLQQNQTMRIHGRADAKEELRISFHKQVVETVAAENGKWSAIIHTGPAGGPFSLQIASKNSETKVVISDVLVGEVWICGGQSNMSFPVSKSKNSKQDIESAKKYSTIRGFNVVQNSSVQPLSDFAHVDSWFCCSTESIKNFSAVAYLFGRELNRELNVPIGLICVAAEGTTLEAWTPYDALQKDGSFERLLEHWRERGEPTNPNRVSNSYNAMVAPIAGFAFRGVIWHQGEANLGRGAQYRRLFPVMISSWRKKLGQPQCPFLFVQPTPFRYAECPKEALPEIWDAQLRTFNRLGNMGMVVTTDLACSESNQPKNKLPVSRRLSNWAFEGCYLGIIAEKRRRKLDAYKPDDKDRTDRTLTSNEISEKRIASGPIFQSANVVDNRMIVKFRTSCELLKLEEPDHGFTICGEDRNFLSAEVRVVGKQLIVTHPEIATPVAVRYGWTDTAKPSLTDDSGLPASPFRSDEFPLLSDGVEF